MDIIKECIENRKARSEVLFGIAEEYERETLILEQIDNDTGSAIIFASILPDIAFSEKYVDEVIPRIKKVFEILNEDYKHKYPEDYEKMRTAFLKEIEESETTE